MSKSRIGMFVIGSLAAALVAAPAARAESPSVSPVMQKAFAKLEQGPDQLRWFVHRTRMIYALSFNEVVNAYEATQTAQAKTTQDEVRVAAVEPDAR